jgi:membrane-associated phospholipid phosphatase
MQARTRARTTRTKGDGPPPAHLHPVKALGALAFGAYVVFALLLVGTGLLVSHVLAHGGVGHWDVSVNRWMARQRAGPLDFWTAVGSQIANTPAVVGIAVVVAVVLALRKMWPYLALLAVGLAVEFATFLTTTLVVDRPRPPVRALDTAPPTSSFPSGHTAAAVVLYLGLAIIVTRHIRSHLMRALVWLVAAAVPVAVGLSRMYRGMHHPTDVMAGALLGTAALLVGLWASQVATAGTSSNPEPDVSDTDMAVVEMAS